MKSGDKYFVRIDRKANSNKVDAETKNAHFQFLKVSATETTMYAGGFENSPGGMIIFSAASLEDAKKKCENDPVISKGFYEYDLFEWKVLLVPESSFR